MASLEPTENLLAAEPWQSCLADSDRKLLEVEAEAKAGYTTWVR